MAWIIGVYIGGMRVNDVIAGFPTPLFLTLAGVTLLFSLAQCNGTLDKLAHHAVRACRGNRGVVPIMFFVLAATLASMGPGNIATAALLAPMAMTTAARFGIPPFLMAIMVGNGANAGALSPFAPTGIIVSGLMARIGMPGHELRTYITLVLAHAMVAFARLLPVRRPEAVQRHSRRRRRGRGCRRIRRRHVRGAPLVHARGDRHLDLQRAVGSDRARLGLEQLAFEVNVGMGAFLGAVVLVLTRFGRRSGGDQADAVEGDHDGLRRDRAHRDPREGAGHRSAGVAGRQDLDARTPSPASSPSSPASSRSTAARRAWCCRHSCRWCRGWRNRWAAPIRSPSPTR